jgi:hypothetical protein
MALILALVVAATAFGLSCLSGAFGALGGAIPTSIGGSIGGSVGS